MSTITDTSLLELLSGLTGRNIPQRNSFDNFIFGLPDVDAGSPSCKPSVRNNIIQIENSINQIYSKYSNALTWNQGGIVTRPDLWDEIKLLLEKLPNDHAAAHARGRVRVLASPSKRFLHNLAASGGGEFFC